MMNGKTPVSNDEVVGDVLAALLAVNSWTVNRTYGLVEPLRRVGLLDFRSVAKLPVEDIADRLSAAGYSRGEFMTTQMATRVLSLAIVLSGNNVAVLSEHLNAGRHDAVEAMLKQARGVGPSVLRNFWILQKHKKQESA
jgi:hypothetical protein